MLKANQPSLSDDEEQYRICRVLESIADEKFFFFDMHHVFSQTLLADKSFFKNYGIENLDRSAVCVRKAQK